MDAVGCLKMLLNAVMQGMMTEDVNMCSWMSANAVGGRDAWHSYFTCCSGMSLDAVVCNGISVDAV